MTEQKKIDDMWSQIDEFERKQAEIRRLEDAEWERDHTTGVDNHEEVKAPVSETVPKWARFFKKRLVDQSVIF